MKNESFEQFTKRNSKRVYNYILRMARNREDAEDITQEVFTAVYARFKEISPEARDAYLYRSAYNRTVNYSRKRQRDPEVQQSEFVEPAMEEETVADDTAVVADRNTAIREALSRLNDNERAAVDMKYFQNLSYKQIAVALDITPAAVDSLLIRARKKLKKIISQDRSDSAV